jgi:hypothetical protein
MIRLAPRPSSGEQLPDEFGDGVPRTGLSFVTGARLGLSNLDLVSLRAGSRIIESRGPAYMLDMNDFQSAVADAMTSTSASLADSLAKDAASSLGTELVQTVLGESAKELVHGIAGPLFRILCHVIDTSQKKLDALIAEPFSTGTRIAVKAFSVAPSTQGDLEFERRQLESATDHLEEAYSIASKLKHPADELFAIKLLQTLLAVRRGSWAYAQMYFQECVPKFKKELALEVAIIECLQEMKVDFEESEGKWVIRCLDDSHPVRRRRWPKGMAEELLFEYVRQLGREQLNREIELLGLSHPPSFDSSFHQEHERLRAAYFKPRIVAAIERHQEERRRLELFLESLTSPES